MDWKDDAACRDMDTDGFILEDPWCLDICSACPVRLPCLKYALVTDSAGIWGGTTEENRVTLRQRKTLLDGEIEIVWEMLDP